MLVADLEELETVDASEIYSKRHNAKERKWKFYFSSRRWTNQTFWKRSGTENIHLDTGTPNSTRRSRRFLGEPEGSLPQPQDSFPDAGEAINDFWSMGNFIYRHHVEPRVKFNFERRIIPYSTEIH